MIVEHQRMLSPSRVILSETGSIYSKSPSGGYLLDILASDEPIDRCASRNVTVAE